MTFSEISETISDIKKRYPGWRVWCGVDPEGKAGYFYATRRTCGCPGRLPPQCSMTVYGATPEQLMERLAEEERIMAERARMTEWDHLVEQAQKCLILGRVQEFKLNGRIKEVAGAIGLPPERLRTQILVAALEKWTEKP